MHDQQIAKLIQRCALGDRSALERLYNQTSAQLFGLILRIVNRRDWAEEIMQEAFINIWNKSDSFSQTKGAAMAWLATIMRNKALDWLRRHPYREVSDDQLPEMELIDSHGPMDSLGLEEDFTRLENCLEELSQDHRKAILLSYYQGFTHSELATRLNSPLGTIKSWIRRGLSQLQACLQ